MVILSEKLIFPSPEETDEDGLLCIGGDLSVERLILAYRSGIFPWYEGDLPLWWNPDPRFVLFPDELKVSASMKQVLRKKTFQVTKNHDFVGVIRNCQQAKRKDQGGTWINEEVVSAYIKLHQMNLALSYETWQNGELVGGFYGIRLGAVFFGESMFSKVSNASKVAFITAVTQFREEQVQLVDCQVYTAHLESLGANMIPRKQFLLLLETLIPGISDQPSGISY